MSTARPGTQVSGRAFFYVLRLLTGLRLLNLEGFSKRDET